MTDQTPTAEVSDWFAQYMVEHAEQCRHIAERRAVCKTVLFDALAAAGITQVLVNFDGYGDSGQIEAITAHRGDDEVPLPEATITFVEPSYRDEPARFKALEIKDAIEELVYDALEETHAGWPNNDGAYGDFTFDVGDRTIGLDYNERYTDSNYSRHEF